MMSQLATHSVMQHSSVQADVTIYCTGLWTETLHLSFQHKIHSGVVLGTRMNRHTLYYFDRARTFKTNEWKIKLAPSVTGWAEKCGTFQNNERGLRHGISTCIVFLNYERNKKAYSHRPTYLMFELIPPTFSFTLIIFGLNFNQYKNISVEDMTAQWAHNVIKLYTEIRQYHSIRFIKNL